MELTHLQGLEDVLKWCEYVVRVEDNRWPKRKWTGHRKEDEDEDDVKWERVAERDMKQRNVTCGDAVNRRLWETENQ